MQSALDTDGTPTEGLSSWNEIAEIKSNSFVEATVAFVEKVSNKYHRGPTSLYKAYDYARL